MQQPTAKHHKADSKLTRLHERPSTFTGDHARVGARRLLTAAHETIRV